MTIVDSGHRRRIVGPVVTTKQEAEAGLLQARAARERGTLSPPTVITFGEWIDHWRDQHAPTVATSTAGVVRDYLSIYVDEPIRRVRLQAVTVQVLRQLDARLVSRGLAVSTRSKIMGLVRAALRLAVEDGLILSTPGDLVKVKQTAIDLMRVDKKRALTPEEVRRLFAAADGHWLEVMVTILFALGLRRGEALGLRWSDINWKSGTVRIEQQLRMSAGQAELAPLKTKSSRRTLGMDSFLRAALIRQQERQAEWKAACGVLWTDSGLVITTETGHWVDPRVPNRVFGLLAREAGIKRLSTHSGRHTNISGQIAAGVPIAVVAARAGHRDGTVTAKAYITVMQDQIRAGGFDLGGYLGHQLDQDPK
ncbi:site-specific integrase [Deinococcus sonorensis]|uniref:Site-specific integrase n=2 Tax=Deinococcus sonorensis TaxID=309891 RepID=A0AAU7UFU5_9DEIO